MSRTSPTQRSLAKLRGEGYLVEVVERWNAHSRTRKDLFGWVDIIAIRDGETLAVQTTSWGNISSRVKKIMESDTLPDVRAAGWLIHVHGWKKDAKGKWQCKVEDIS